MRTGTKLGKTFSFIGVTIRSITPNMLLEIVSTVLLRDDESPTSGDKAQGVLFQNSVSFSGLKTDTLLLTFT